MKAESNHVTTEGQALEALDNANVAITQHAMSPAAKDLTPPDLTELCKVYHSIKPFVQTALPLVKSIPVYGPKIAAVITFLLQVADLACP